MLILLQLLFCVTCLHVSHFPALAPTPTALNTCPFNNSYIPNHQHSLTHSLTYSSHCPSDDELKFDMETAFKVLRSAGYAAHALSVAERAGQPEWILDVLLEDMGSYAEAVAFIGEGCRGGQCEGGMEGEGETRRES